MAIDVQPESESGVVELLQGIFADLQALFKQQLALLKCEIRRELIRTATAAGLLVAGFALALCGAGLLLLMAVHWRCAAVTGLPLWGGYGIIGGGGILLGRGAGLVRQETARGPGARAGRIGAGFAGELGMADSPQIIRRQMEETRAALDEKIETLEEQITRAVTISAEEASEAMKKCCNVGEQFHRNPWWFFCGAVAIGFFLARALFGKRKHQHEHEPESQPTWRDESSDFMRKSDDAVADESSESPSPAASEKPSALEAFVSQPNAAGEEHRDPAERHDKSAELKSLLIGAGLGVLRELAVKRAPNEMRQFLGDVMNAFTTKMGGEVITCAGAAKPSNASAALEAAESKNRAGRIVLAAPGLPRRSGLCAL